MKKKIGILTFSRFEARPMTGSSKIRGNWLQKYLEGSEIFNQGQEYETVIFQKAYWLEYVKIYKGIKILDVADPDWLNWQYRIKEIVDYCSAITTSTEVLAMALRKLTDKPVLCIPDRVDLEEFRGLKKVQKEIADTIVWYGYSQNFKMLEDSILAIIKLGFKNLIVVSDTEFILPNHVSEKLNVTNYLYEDSTAYQHIMEGDIVINPQADNAKWKFKSNNKTIISWALGMPVAHTEQELENLIPFSNRISYVEEAQKELAENYDIKLSAKEYLDLIEKLKNENN